MKSTLSNIFDKIQYFETFPQEVVKKMRTSLNFFFYYFYILNDQHNQSGFL